MMKDAMDVMMPCVEALCDGRVSMHANQILADHLVLYLDGEVHASLTVSMEMECCLRHVVEVQQPTGDEHSMRVRWAPGCDAACT